MSHYTYLTVLDYDITITYNSVFLAWIITDKLTFERLSENSIQPRELQNDREKNSGVYKYFPSADEEKYKSNLNAVLEWYEYSDKLCRKIEQMRFM